MTTIWPASFLRHAKNSPDFVVSSRQKCERVFWHSFPVINIQENEFQKTRGHFYLDETTKSGEFFGEWAACFLVLPEKNQCFCNTGLSAFFFEKWPLLMTHWRVPVVPVVPTASCFLVCFIGLFVLVSVSDSNVSVLLRSSFPFLLFPLSSLVLLLCFSFYCFLFGCFSFYGFVS